MTKLSIYIHKIFHPMLITIFKSLRKHNLIYVNDFPKISENAVFAVNHSSKYDMPYASEVIAKQCYVIVAKQPLNLIDRLSFILNGAVWFDRKNNTERKSSAQKMIDLLRNGANFIIFPEGTWNLTPSKPMLPLYWGIIDIARASGRPIVPIVLEYTDKKCYVAFGESMEISPTDDKGEKISELADRFATLKWSIWEQFSDTGCNTAEEWSAEVQKRLAEYPKLDYEYETSVIRKEYDTADEVFAHLNELTPNSKTAFLYNKRNHF